MALPADFAEEVRSIVAQIPRGRVATYGGIARLAGMPGYARHVGHVLAEAPDTLPCHRVVNAAGRTVPGWAEQRTLLENEGIRFKANGCVDLARCGWEAMIPI